MTTAKINPASKESLYLLWLLATSARAKQLSYKLVRAGTK